MAEKDEMKTLLPGRNVTLNTGEIVRVSPVGFGKSVIFADSIAALFEKLGKEGLKLSSINDWKTLFSVAFEETLAIMGLVLDRPRDFFDNIDLADGLELLDAIVEQNWNDRVKKSATSLLDRFGSRSQTRFKLSSVQDIAGKISSAIPPDKSSSSSDQSESSGPSKEEK